MKLDQPLELSASAGRLSLTPVNSNWCQAVVTVGEARWALGAWTPEGIVSRLLAFLSEPSSGMKSVCGFNELHGWLYAEHTGDGAVLHFQDASSTGPKWLAKLPLSPAECRRWIEELSALNKD